MPTEKSQEQALTVMPADAFMSMIERFAKDPTVDVEKMERLLELGVRMNAVRAEAMFHSALSSMQDQIPIIEERGLAVFSPTDKRPFAQFEDIVEIVRPILSEHGFSIMFTTVNQSSKEITVTGHLMHQAGHSKSSTLTFPADDSGKKNPAQALSSALSYAKRQLTNALLSIATRAPSEDDDGESAGKRPEPITEAQVLELEGLLTEAKADRLAFLKWLGCDSLDAIPAPWFERCKAALLKKARPMDAAKEELRARQAAQQPAPEQPAGPGEPGLDDERIASPAEPTPQPSETAPPQCNHEKIAGRVGPQLCPDCNTNCNTAQIRAGEGRAAKGKR